MTLRLLIFMLGVLAFDQAFGQISQGGIPPDFNNPTHRAIELFEMKAPDFEYLLRQDDSVSHMGVPQRLGVIIPVNVSPVETGSWELNSSGTYSWKLNIRVDGAVGLGLYFSDFKLNEGEELYVYSDDHRHIIGAFTQFNNKPDGVFATEVVKGESIILELVTNNPSISDVFRITDVLVVYTPFEFTLTDGSRILRESDNCEVNIKCEEGDNWFDQANGVVRIMVRNNQVAYWCTGSVVNNTALDYAPLVLTANHCALSNGVYSSPTDVAQWVFYFKHESVSCVDNTPSGTRTMTGGVKLASSNSATEEGSDFYLLELFEKIPNSYSPYFNGWNALDEISDEGVSIHHPAGDVKKISTYNSMEIAQWGITPNSHFMLQWSATQNGHGVTEGGSSGAPLFNSSKLIIGQLTGGESSCSNLTGPDYFGRLFLSWESAGESDSLRLAPWLDPISSGLRLLQGTYNTKVALAQFATDQNVVPVGSYANFNDLSVNSPDTWEWYFEGGSPSTSESQEPGNIYYHQLGTYDVLLVVTNEYGSDSSLLEDYIRVVPTVFPNPTRNKINILFGDDPDAHQITITNVAGKIMKQFEVPASIVEHEFSFMALPAGLYIVGIKSATVDEHYKVLYIPR